MGLWHSSEIAAATEGCGTGDWVAESVTIDSRSIKPAALFVALTGGASDGHAYVHEAIAKGAAGALVSRYVEGVPEAQQILVADTEKALQQLGVAARARSAAKFLGITGSVGKTGCKEMLKAALKVCGNTHATEGNLNNHLGVPLTLANMPKDTQFAVLEMGMNHAGEIAALSRIVRPDVAIITTVDAVHIEFFDSVEGIADAKSEMFVGMQQQGVAVLNADNPHYARCRKHAEKQGLDRILSFGTSPQALCRLLHYRIEDLHAVVDASITGTELRYRLGAIGKHWALMSVAVLAMVEAVGGDMAKAAAQFEFFSEPKGRGQIRKLAVKGGHLRLVDDCYNASPISMRGAVEKIAELRDASPEPCRTLVVLGDMLELGEHAHDMHVGLVPSLINNQMDLVFAAGKFMESMYHALPESMRGAYALSSGELAPTVVSALRDRDLVLVKGSRGSKMELVVQAMETNAARFDAGEA
jgi:UDP-N-acetylmuramoyl-tripeptide--D-alanyl-D-alanine ligase